MSPESLAHLLPEAHVGKVHAAQPVTRGLSGAGVYAISSTRGELILRVHRAEEDPARWQQQLLILRRAAERGVAPAIVYVDEAARAVVCRRVAGVPLGQVLGDPQQRPAVIASIVGQLRELHRLESTHIAERNPVSFVRAEYAVQRARTGFPAWASKLDATIDAAAAVLERDQRRVVSHNDMNPGNILWDGTRAWLVDWEVAGLTHPFFDLAVLAMFLQLDAATAQQLLALQEQRALDASEHATFASLRQLAALLCGIVFTRLVPDLSLLPESPKTLSEVYAAMAAGELDLLSPSGQGAFAIALLRLGIGG